MEEYNDKRIEEYVRLLNELTERTGDELTASRLLTEIAKDRRMDHMRKEKTAHTADAATEKQLQLLKKLGVKVPSAGLTKRQASEMLDEALEGQE